MRCKLLGTLMMAAAVSLGCTSVPRGLAPVTGFEGDRYLGKWYEIARLNHAFEKNLSNVSAVYAKTENDGITVRNRGFNEKTGQWKQIEGRARFIDDETVGSLKVSFFGPFYGGYHVIALDKENYRYAMVAGPSRSYLWILSRTPSLNDAIYARLISRAADWGFDTSALIAVKHDRPDE